MEKDKTMNRKHIIAAFAVVVFVTAAAGTASAHVDFNLNLGGGYPSYYPEPYPVYPPYPTVDYGYDDDDNADCGYEYITVKKWNRYHDRYRILHKRVWVCN
jgi:hypothetical protein